MNAPTAIGRAFGNAETIAELRRLYSEWQETVNPYGFRLMPSGEYYALVAAAVNALPALLDAAAERDALAAKVERLVAVHASYFDLDGRPGYDDTNPAPEDVWRFDRDFRAALDEEAQS